MKKNITPFNQFKDIKNGKVSEMVEPINDMYRVSLDVDVPKSLINTFIKKVKDETTRDLRQSKSEMQLAEKIVQYVNENFIVIENLPVSMVVSTDQKAVQSQVQTDELAPEPQLQTQEEPPVAQSPQVQVSQPGDQNQVQVQTQGQQVQQAALDISATEI